MATIFPLAAQATFADDEVTAIQEALRQHFKVGVRFEADEDSKTKFMCRGPAVKGHRVSVSIAPAGTVVTEEALLKKRKWLKQVAESLKQFAEFADGVKEFKGVKPKTKIKIPKTDNLAGVGLRSFSSIAFGPEAMGEDVDFTTSDGSHDVSVSVTALANDDSDSVDLALSALEIARVIDKLHKKGDNKAVDRNRQPPDKSKSK